MTTKMINLKNCKKPLVIAHRGYKSEYPENTLAAYEAAIQCGAEMIELDVTLTRDRKIIVIHDDTLERTTNGSGMVHHFTYDELQKLDAGSWFDSKFKGERLPSLEDVLTLSKNKTLVNVEIKQSAYEPSAPPDAIENQVLNLIKKMDLAEQVLISSFKKDILYNIRKMNKDIALSFLTEYPIDNSVLDILKDIQAFSWNQDISHLNKDDIDRMHVNNYKVITFMVNTPEDAKKCLDMGVDGIFTDYPGILDKIR